MYNDNNPTDAVLEAGMRLLDSADDAGCSEDMIVVSKHALNVLAFELGRLQQW